MRCGASLIACFVCCCLLWCGGCGVASYRAGEREAWVVRVGLDTQIGSLQASTADGDSLSMSDVRSQPTLQDLVTLLRLVAAGGGGVRQNAALTAASP